MSKINLPIDTKSLYFNIKNDNLSGHTATVASPLRKTNGSNKLEDILLIKNKEIDISNKKDLIALLIQHSKSKVLIKNMFVFDKLAVNGKRIYPDVSFGCYIKEEIDETKVQFGRLKLHYPSKLIYEDLEVNINNKKVYKAISNELNDYAFIVQSFDYDFETEILNFDALIVGENSIPYSKVFINEKGVGNKFNRIFNENADDYDREIISLRKKFGVVVDPYNYLDYMHEMRKYAYDCVEEKLSKNINKVSSNYPYSLFDFYYEEDGIRKYGILRVTSNKTKYFNLSFIQQAFMMKNEDDVFLYLVSNIYDLPEVTIYNFEKLSNLSMSINSMKYEEDL